MWSPRRQWFGFLQEGSTAPMRGSPAFYPSFSRASWRRRGNNSAIVTLRPSISLDRVLYSPIIANPAKRIRGEVEVLVSSYALSLG